MIERMLLNQDIVLFSSLITISIMFIGDYIANKLVYLIKYIVKVVKTWH